MPLSFLRLLSFRSFSLWSGILRDDFQFSRRHETKLHQQFVISSLHRCLFLLFYLCRQKLSRRVPRCRLWGWNVSDVCSHAVASIIFERWNYFVIYKRTSCEPTFHELDFWLMSHPPFPCRWLCVTFNPISEVTDAVPQSLSCVRWMRTKRSPQMNRDYSVHTSGEDKKAVWRGFIHVMCFSFAISSQAVWKTSSIKTALRNRLSCGARSLVASLKKRKGHLR